MVEKSNFEALDDYLNFSEEEMLEMDGKSFEDVVNQDFYDLCLRAELPTIPDVVMILNKMYGIYCEYLDLHLELYEDEGEIDSFFCDHDYIMFHIYNIVDMCGDIWHVWSVLENDTYFGEISEIVYDAYDVFKK